MVRVSTPRSPHSALIFALQAALLAALAGAGWSVYRRLPPGAGDDLAAVGRATSQRTMLRITMRRAPGDLSAAQGTTTIPVQLYSIDLLSARREYFNERRPGQRFEDFLTRRMGARQPITVLLDAEGQTIVPIPPGRWWIHAGTLDGVQEITWRLPVNVAGREQHIELTPANAYMKSKSF